MIFVHLVESIDKMIALFLLISIILQFSAAFMAFSLIKITKFNISWILISIAFLFMSVGLTFRLAESLNQHFNNQIINSFYMIDEVMNILISLLIFVGVIFIKKIFNLQKRIDELRKQSENRVLHAIIITEEKEKQRFAKDLHDGLGPLLSMMKMSVSALLKTNKIESEREIITNIDTLVTESITTIKEIANNLSPHILDNFGLTSAVNSFVAKVTQNQHISIVVHSNCPEERFDYNKEIVLYRIILELISNTIKHSGASAVIINIEIVRNIVKVTYKDNGKGFNSEDIMSTNNGMGYSNIHSRVKSIGGILDIKSKTGDGLEVVIECTK